MRKRCTSMSKVKLANSEYYFFDLVTTRILQNIMDMYAYFGRGLGSSASGFFVDLLEVVVDVAPRFSGSSRDVL